ncbi:MAG: hypothetical protein AAF583_04210 [Pseudomonadota bacterium]
MADRREPIEVFEAALGNPSPLASLLRSEKSLGDRTRLALAMFLEGKLVRLKNGRGRQRKFRYWEEFMRSAHVRAAMLVEFEGHTHKNAAKEALSDKYPPSSVNATEEQLLDYLRKSEGQRPTPPEPLQLRNVEDWIQYQFEEHQRKTRPK